MALLSESQLETVRPSALARVLACPGSRRLAMKAPEKGSSSFADEGSAAHSLAEQCLTSRRWEPFEFFGKSISHGGKDHRVNNDMVAAVSKYTSVVRDDLKRAGPSSQVFFEKQVWLEEIQNSGTVDCVILDAKPLSIKVHDYKHGKGVYVSEVWNAQFLAYALAFLNVCFRGISAASLSEMRVEMTVHQPRFPGVKPARTHAISGTDLVGWRDAILLPKLEATRAPDAPIVGGSHCQFCPCKPICTEYLTVQRAKFQHVPIQAAPIPAGFTI